MSSDWHQVKLGNLVNIKHGFAFKGEFFSDTPTSFQLTTPGNFAIGGGFQAGKGKFYSGPVPEDYVLKAGDLLVTMTDLSKAADTLGYAAAVPDSPDTTWLHNQRVGLISVKPDALLNKGFVHYLMRSPEYRHWVVSTATGSTVKHTSPGRICEFEFNLPPIEYQHYVAEMLGALDDRITLLRETNTTLEAIAQALFKSWFVDFDPVHAKMQGRAPEGMDEATVALFPDSFEESELGDVPKGWRSGDLNTLAELNPESWSAKHHPGRVLYVDLANTKAGQIDDYIDFSFEEAPSRARRVLRCGDVIVGTVRPGNRSFARIASDVTGLTGSTGFAVLRSREVVDQALVYIAATNDEAIDRLSHLADGGAYPAVRPEVVGTTPLVIAPEAIRNSFGEIANPLFASIGANQDRMKQLASLRDTLLPRLISGQISLSEFTAETI
jgi:type I restriction enzyme S subunit